jgi:putative GTP pyrophosphokinase
MNDQLNLDEVVGAYQQKKTLYEKFTNALHQFLEEKLKARAIADFRVSSRTKSINSFKEKVVRPGKQYVDPLRQLTDLAGVRIIVCYVDQLDQVEDVIKSEFNIDPTTSVDKSRTMKPDTFGYLSVHYIVTPTAEKARSLEWLPFADMKAEVQVRTSLQDSWATVSHALQYKVESAVPDSLKRRLFRLAGLFELADEEFSKIKWENQERAKEVTEKFAKGQTNMAIDSLSIAQFLNQSLLMQGVISYARQYSFKIDKQELLEHYNRLDCSLVTEECVRLRINTIEELEAKLKDTQQGNSEFVKSISLGRVWRTTSAFLLFLLIIKAFPERFVPEYLASKYGWDYGVALNVIRIAKDTQLKHRY